MSDLDIIFKRLGKWKNFPKYQLERRVDIYFAMFLHYIMNKQFDEKINEEMIIPEFPLKKEDSNQSNNVDFAVIGTKALYLVELKTDMRSRNQTQDDYLETANGKTLSELVEDIKTIHKAATGISKMKYQNLLNYLENYKEKNPLVAEIVYIQPEPGKYTIIPFSKVIEYIDDSENENPDDCETKTLANSFLAFLKTWADNETK